MEKIIIIIGQSASGKTTYIRKNFLNGNLEFIDQPFKITIVNKGTLLLGHHRGEKRCEGSDELSMSILPKLIEFIESNINNYSTIIMEGDRITNEKFFRFVHSLNLPVDLYVTSCSLNDSIKRRIQAGSKPSETFVKTTKTKTIRMRNLGRKLGFNIIDIDTSIEKIPTLIDFIKGGETL